MFGSLIYDVGPSACALRKKIRARCGNIYQLMLHLFFESGKGFVSIRTLKASMEF